MAKKMVHLGAKKTLIKRSNKKTTHKLIHYLLSDSYFYAPLLISPSPTTGIGIWERTKDNRSLMKKIQDYLKSDCHMFAPLLAPQSSTLRVREKEETGSGGYVKNVSRGVSRTTKNRGGEEVVVMSDFVEARVNATPRESSIYSKSPSLSISGERDPKIRRIVVD